MRRSSIGQNDTVLEIGPGKGFITAELLKIAKKVIAVELDQKLILHLNQFLGHDPNLELHQANFLDFSLTKYPYKVFANPPFSIEGEVIRKLLDFHNVPVDCYLIVDKRLALRLSGMPHENQFSLKHKPWFDFSIYHEFKKSDFIPEPKVDSVMWRITKKERPPFPIEEKQSWEKFVEAGFGQGTPIRQNLSRVLTRNKLQEIQSKCSFSLRQRPGYVTLKQWFELYKQIKKP